MAANRDVREADEGDEERAEDKDVEIAVPDALVRRCLAAGVFGAHDIRNVTPKHPRKLAPACF